MIELQNKSQAHQNSPLNAALTGTENLRDSLVVPILFLDGSFETTGEKMSILFRATLVLDCCLGGRNLC